MFSALVSKLLRAGLVGVQSGFGIHNTKEMQNTVDHFYKTFDVNYKVINFPLHTFSYSFFIVNPF